MTTCHYEFSLRIQPVIGSVTQEYCVEFKLIRIIKEKWINGNSFFPEGNMRLLKFNTGFRKVTVKLSCFAESRIFVT
jgi:hypothetical protein